MDLPFALEGFFFEKVDGSTGHFHFPLYYICASLTPHAATAPFAWQAAESNSAPFAVLHVNDVCRWTWQLLLRGSFSKRSTARRVNGSTGQRVKRVNGSLSLSLYYMIADDARLTPPCCKKHTGSTGWRVNGSTGQMGQRVTFTFTILYMIADDARLTPPGCKKHTAYDDTRLTPHRCKKHTASFARSTGRFPSNSNFENISLQ